MVEQQSREADALDRRLVSKRAYAVPKLREYGRLSELTQGTYKYGYRDVNAGSYYPTFLEPKQ